MKMTSWPRWRGTAGAIALACIALLLAAGPVDAGRKAPASAKAPKCVLLPSFVCAPPLGRAGFGRLWDQSPRCTEAALRVCWCGRQFPPESVPRISPNR